MKVSLKCILCSSDCNPAESSNFMYFFDIKLGQRLDESESKREKSKSVNYNGSNK